MFTPIQKILPKAISRLKMTRQTHAAFICEKYRKLAPQFVHREALKFTSPHFFRDRILIINVANSAWAGHLAKCKPDLIKAINATLGHQEIKDLKTRLDERVCTE